MRRMGIVAACAQEETRTVFVRARMTGRSFWGILAWWIQFLVMCPPHRAGQMSPAVALMDSANPRDSVFQGFHRIMASVVKASAGPA